jgi:NAD(P)-dependent dehydrogenase (short-subunit alcohol dehydrogenase family)
MPTVFITGARTGLGEEFARQYRGDGWQVIAPSRSAFDVTDRESIESFVRGLDGTPIDLLINNAGVRMVDPSACTLGSFTLEGWLPTIAVNTVGPALVTQALLPNLIHGAGKKIVTLSSRLGSIEAGGGTNSGGGGSSYYAYRASKSAVHQVNKCLSVDLAPLGFICALLNPGWVRTGMGGEQAVLSPGESVVRMRRIIEQLTPAQNGKLVDCDGTILPW